MTAQYVVVEGAFDKFLLEHILPQQLVSQSKILVGYSDNSALSKACSLLVSSERPVVLIVDSDTTDHANIEETKDFMTQSLRQYAKSERFHVVISVPEIEIVFFSNRKMTDELINGKITDLQWELARYCPKKVLCDILHTENLQTSLHKLLTPVFIEKLRKTDFIQDIINNSRVPAY
ncbi:MAG: DUF4276 family protein [Gammaproteobacteria bacterium]|nr:DUF4276 family protein [Gammaproteobacteria bacterium]